MEGCRNQPHEMLSAFVSFEKGAALSSLGLTFRSRLNILHSTYCSVAFGRQQNQDRHLISHGKSHRQTTYVGWDEKTEIIIKIALVEPTS